MNWEDRTVGLIFEANQSLLIRESKFAEHTMLNLVEEARKIAQIREGILAKARKLGRKVAKKIPWQAKSAALMTGIAGAGFAAGRGTAPPQHPGNVPDTPAHVSTDTGQESPKKATRPTKGIASPGKDFFDYSDSIEGLTPKQRQAYKSRQQAVKQAGKKKEDK